MRQRPDMTRAAFIVCLACTASIGDYEVSSAGPQEVESSRVVEGSKVTLQYMASVPGPAGVEYGDVSEFIQGQHEIFPALEQEVVGMTTGEEKKVELKPEQGFGLHDDGKKLEISKTLLPPGAKEGDVLQNDLGEFATVAEVSDTTAILDNNHPLAGKPLVVQLKILKVENP
jgi:FKBP-type peptidyl-prolyl cis-trans isomerase 2